MRRLAPALAVVFFAWAAPTNAKPIVNVQASSTLGAAPLTVTLTATGDAVAYHWDLGDRSVADGPVVQHQYGPGRFTAKVTATGADGETAQASVVITSVKLALAGPKVGTYGRRAQFHGRMVPALRGAPIALYSGETPLRSTRLDRKGRFAFRVRQSAPATYSARFENIPSNPAAVAVRPGLDVAVPRSGMIGRPLVVRAVLRPRGSGRLHVRIWRSGRELPAKDFRGHAVVRLSTKRVAKYVIRVEVTPTGSFTGRKKTVRTNVFLPYLAQGASGPSVQILERRLADLHYLLRGVDGFYSYDTVDAVLAFQKVNGLARTGRVTPAVWRRLQAAHVPSPRYRYGHHLEVDKTRQVLFEVDHGRVVRVVHVSTGATGNTPVGRWRIYSKVPGTLPSGMFDSNFFLRGFAIHGYPSVPPYPASHGCVRMPNWAAPILFASSYYGETIYIYY
jgi:N-acetylmuramoyl-L-alanine amidase